MRQTTIFHGDLHIFLRLKSSLKPLENSVLYWSAVKKLRFACLTGACLLMAATPCLRINYNMRVWFSYFTVLLSCKGLRLHGARPCTCITRLGICILLPTFDQFNREFLLSNLPRNCDRKLASQHPWFCLSAGITVYQKNNVVVAQEKSASFTDCVLSSSI